MIYDDDGLPHGSKRLLLVAALLAGLALAALAGFAYRRRRLRQRVLARFGSLALFAAIGRPRLSLVTSLLFIGLSIPILIFILIYNYNKNSAGMVSILNDAVARTSRAGVERTQDLIESTESPLRFIAEVAAADPGYFRSEQSNDLLYRALTSAAPISTPSMPASRMVLIAW